MQKPTVVGTVTERPALAARQAASMRARVSPKGSGPPSTAGYEQRVALLEKGETLATLGWL